MTVDMLLITLLILVVLGLSLIIWKNSQSIEELESTITDLKKENCDLIDGFENSTKIILQEHGFHVSQGFAPTEHLPFWEARKAQEDGSNIVVCGRADCIEVAKNSGITTISFGNIHGLLQAIETKNPS